METLSESSLYSQTASVGDQFRDLVKAMQDQHSLSVVVVIDALDECFAEYNEHWRTLLEPFQVGLIYQGRSGLWSPVVTFPTFVVPWRRSAIP